MNKVVESETKPLLLSDYINRMKNLGFEDDQIKDIISSLLEIGVIAIEPTKPMIEFIKYKV